MDYPQEQQNFGLDTISTNSSQNAMQIRLDPTEILSDINDFLNGTVTFIDYEQGQPVKKCRQIGEPLANQIGVQNLMMFLRSTINPLSVQGNYNDERYNLDRKFLRRNLAIIICVNRDKWGIKPINMDIISESIMDMIKKVSSRTLYNEERKSYTTSLQTKETHSVIPEQQKSRFGLS